MTNVQHSHIVYIGTYTHEEGQQHGRPDGIYVCSFDDQTGKLEVTGTTPGTPNPTYLTLSPDRRCLYAVNEVSDFEGKDSGAVSAFAVDEQTGALNLLNTQPTSSPGPCYISLDQTGHWALVANYGGGSVSVLPVSDDGRLGAASVRQHEGQSVDPERQEAPHAHCTIPDPSGRFILTADLGLDKIFVYRLDAESGTLTTQAEFSVQPGSGPRHLAFHPNGRYLYVSNELDSTVRVYAFDAGEGGLREVQSLPSIPPGFSGRNYPAQIVVAPSGRFVYVSNRGHDSMAIFAINPDDGQLSAVGYVPTEGHWPRHFAIDGSGNWLLAANQNTGNVVVFRVETQTGNLLPTGQQIAVPKPVCVCFRAV